MKIFNISPVSEYLEYFKFTLNIELFPVASDRIMSLFCPDQVQDNVCMFCFLLLPIKCCFVHD